jgi:hypothetical protein
VGVDTLVIVGAGKVQVAHMIVDTDYSYMWGDGEMKFGIKMAKQEILDVQPGAGNSPQNEAAIDMNEKSDYKCGGWKLILWTCRENEKKRAYLDEAVEFCRSHGVEFDAVNEPHYETDFRDHRPLRKPYFTYSIDDRNVGGMMDWDLIRRIILEGEEVKIVPVADSTKA